ncbi:dihydrofolate reductase family protein [Kibdelosporangium lantanae]|uniref:Dihydrofolate reductase family protein n=1 Tax=Kibdelosporangium lantanae TaxID=1497396 RepID=A0ABW3MEB5_9PSEU
MRKLTYLVAATIDGHITGPDNGNPDFFLYAGDHMDELRTEYPEALPTQARDFFGVADTPAKHFDTVLQGRSTWELGAREGMTNTYRHLRNIVFSRSITESPDPTVEFVATDPVAKVRELKAEPGMGIWLCGGGRLAAVLRPEIDEIVVKLHPIVAGTGIPMFSGHFSPASYKLVDVKQFDSGVVHLTYASA